MAGVTTTIRDGKKRCADLNHEGPRWRPLSEFQKDRSQANGLKSRCRVCFNAGVKARYEADPDTKIKAINDRRHARTAARDAQDEAYLDEVDSMARKQTAQQQTKAAERQRKEADKAERERVAREKRLASDLEPLRPDDFTSDSDFDVSVSNDTRAGATKVSARAASEKRQEFNARMGRHMGAVRQAAVDEARGDANMIDTMPKESGQYIGELAEQERRFSNRRLARSLSLYAAQEEQARRLFMMAARQYLDGRVTPTGYAAKSTTSRKMKRSVVLLLSDLHLGADLSGAENPMPFRSVEEARRLEYVMRQAIDYKPQYRNDSELVLLLNGDLIEGLLMHDFRDGAPLTEQKVIFLRYFERMLGEFARTFPRVRVFCQPGNHGRNLVRHPGRATSSKWDGIEWELYYSLSRACAHLKNVTWDLPFRAIGIVDLHGQNLLLTHADTEVKLGDPDTKARDNLAIIDKINATRLYGVEFAGGAFGHYHKGRYIPGRTRLIFNAALIPPNGHARTSGYIGEACGQFLFEAVEGHIIGDVRFIEVGPEQDKDERLGTIIEPFRFDLE